MNKFENKYHNTAYLMDQALLLLIEKKDFNYITVKELCKKAGVNRSTFYLHYESMDDLLLKSVEFLFRQLQNKYESLIDGENIKTASLEDLKYFKPKYSIPYLEFLKENKKVFIYALNNQKLFQVDKSFNNLYEKFFQPIQNRFSIPKEEQKYVIKFYLGGIHSIIIEWIKNDCTESVDFIANLIDKYMNVGN